MVVVGVDVVVVADADPKDSEARLIRAPGREPGLEERLPSLRGHQRQHQLLEGVEAVLRHCCCCRNGRNCQAARRRHMKIAEQTSLLSARTGFGNSPLSRGAYSIKSLTANLEEVPESLGS